MAFTAELGEYKAGRSDIFTVDPRALVVDWKKNLSRNGQEPVVDESLQQLALDMVPKGEAGGSSGQLNAILTRPLSDRRLEVIGGFRRMRAALWLIESGTCPDFKVKYVVSRVTDAEAALTNISENMQREDPKPIQFAHAVRTLIEDYGLEMKDIASRLKRSEGYLTKLLDLVMLPKPIQASVANGETPVSAALELAKIDGPEQIATFNEIAGNGEKVTAAKVRQKRQEKREATGEGAPITRSKADIQAFLEGKTGQGENGNKFACFFIDWIDGKKNDNDFDRFWDRYFGKQIKANDKAALAEATV